jgi:hypothetical protein
VRSHSAHLEMLIFPKKQIAKKRRFRYSSLRIPMFPHYVLHSRYTKATHTWWSIFEQRHPSSAKVHGVTQTNFLSGLPKIENTSLAKHLLLSFETIDTLPSFLPFMDC